jgi:hypothetical protein
MSWSTSPLIKLTRLEVAEPANVAIYPWDWTSPLAQTINPDSDDTVSSVSPSENIVVPGKGASLVCIAQQKANRIQVAWPASLAIYPWDLTPPQSQTLSPASSDISFSVSSSVHRSVRTLDRPVSQSQVKSTFSIVTTKVITSVLSFKSVQPIASNAASNPGSLNTSSNFAAPSCNGQINSPAEFVLTVRILGPQL